MSYDIRIIRSDAPHTPALDMLDVGRLVAAVESFPPFAMRGFTWEKQDWTALAEFAGLYMLLSNHAPGETSAGEFDYEAGEAEYCDMHMAGGDFDLDRCYELAAHVARKTGARAWDLQTGDAIEPN